MTGRIGVVIAEDQSLLRASLAELVDSDPDLYTAAEVGDGRAAVQAVARQAPGLALIDIRMPVLDGLAATREIVATHPATKVVVLTTFDLDEYVYEALRAGATGFLLKNTPAPEILRALHTVRAGHAMLAPEVTRRLITDVATRRPPARRGLARLTALSDREREVIGAVVAGLSNEEIASRLFLSLATVKTYLSRLFLKLDVRDRTQLVILAYESGFVELLHRTESTFD